MTTQDPDADRVYVKCPDCGETMESGCGCECEEESETEEQELKETE